MQAQHKIMTPNALIIPENWPIRRINIREEKFIDPTYAQKYDNTSIFYDVFQAGNKVYLIGPPLLNLAPVIDNCQAIDQQGQAIKLTLQTKLLERGQLSWIDLTPELQKKGLVSLQFDLANLLPSGQNNTCLKVEIGADLNPDFADSKALMTLQLNNKLEWIHDWAKYYQVIHDVDTVFVYDNKSSHYSKEEILQSLTQVEGLKNIIIVAWDYKYGPQGKPWTGPNTPWDSDFCQIGALQHMRFRFSLQSKGFINADIDELITPLTEINLFEALGQSPQGVIGVEGNTIEGHKSNFNQESAGIPHFYHFWERKTSISGGTRKWIGAPCKWQDENIQTTAHWVRGISYQADPRFSIGHFRSINDGWKIKSRAESFTDTKEALRSDLSLVAALYRAFPQAFSPEVLATELRQAESLILTKKENSIDFQQGLRSGLTLITERHIPWVKNWVWNNNVLVFETTTPFGQVAFDVVNAQDYIHLNISVRDINQFKVFAEKMLAKDYRLKILSNSKGFSIGHKSKKDFKSFEDAARYFGRLILEWYHIL